MKKLLIGILVFITFSATASEVKIEGSNDGNVDDIINTRFEEVENPENPAEATGKADNFGQTSSQSDAGKPDSYANKLPEGQFEDYLNSKINNIVNIRCHQRVDNGVSSPIRFQNLDDMLECDNFKKKITGTSFARKIELVSKYLHKKCNLEIQSIPSKEYDQCVFMPEQMTAKEEEKYIFELISRLVNDVREFGFKRKALLGDSNFHNKWGEDHEVQKGFIDYQDEPSRPSVLKEATVIENN